MAKFTTYLYRIARNRLIDASRRQKIRPFDAGAVNSEQDLIDESMQQPEQLAETQQQLNKIKQLVTQLPDQQRDTFLLKEESGLGISEISQICHCNEETVKSRLRYAYARLREGMKKFNSTAETDRRRNTNTRRQSSDDNQQNPENREA